MSLFNATKVGPIFFRCTCPKGYYDNEFVMFCSRELHYCMWLSVGLLSVVLLGSLFKFKTKLSFQIEMSGRTILLTWNISISYSLQIPYLFCLSLQMPLLGPPPSKI